MKRARLRFGRGFKVATGNGRSQCATMTLEPGGNEGGPDNRHRGADQWLFVEAGTGVAIIDNTRVSLRPGSIVLIERGETHEIRNTGRAPLKTLNVYVPPAYTASGNELPRGGR